MPSILEMNLVSSFGKHDSAGGALNIPFIITQRCLLLIVIFRAWTQRRYEYTEPEEAATRSYTVLLTSDMGQMATFYSDAPPKYTDRGLGLELLKRRKSKEEGQSC